MLTGQTGIIKQAQEARKQTEIGNLKDYVKQDLLEELMKNGGEDLTAKQMYDVLNRYFDEVPDLPKSGDLTETVWENFPDGFPDASGKLKAREEYGGYEIEIGDIYSGNLRGTPVTGQQIAENLKDYQGTKEKMQYVDIGLDINGENGTGADTTDDWEVFYAGNESGEYRIFLIAADYVPVEKLQKWNIIGTGTTLGNLGNHGLKQYNNYTYSVYWGWGYYTTGEVIPWMGLPTTPNNFMELVKHTQFTLKEGNQNAGAVSQLLNRTAWNGIITNAEKKDKIDFCIGGPTLEMWCEAWSKAVAGDKNGFKPITAGEVNTNGYYVSSEEDDMKNKTFLYMDGKQVALGDELKTTLESQYPTFFPHTSIKDNCNGYWLASPSATYPDALPGCYYKGSVNAATFSSDHYGVRPVVCLTSGVQLQKNEEKSKGGTIVYDLV